MQSRFFTRNQNPFFPFALLIIGVFLLTFLSCKPGKQSRNPTCVKLTRAQIQKWVNKKYTDPTNPNHMTSLEFTTAYAGPGAIFSVYVMGVRNDGTRIPESLTELTPVDKDVCTVKLSDFLLVGTIPRKLSELNILKNDGTIIDSLEYLKLVPVDFKDPTTKLYFLAYDNYNIKKGGVTFKYTEVLPPCPPCPNCIAPCPPPRSCFGTPCETATDSL